jgi:hypothetical protein
MNINHNFETITEGKVYKSGVIPPDEIAGYVRVPHQIYSGRMPGTDDLTLNPEKLEKYRQKRMLSQKLMGLIILVTHPSKFQTKKT